MAKRTIYQLIDDLDGSMADETVQLTVDGVAYEVDLTKGHADALRAALAPYVGVARKVHAPVGTRPHRAVSSKSSRGERDSMRAWFNSLTEGQRAAIYGKGGGGELGERGRIPEAVEAAYVLRDSRADLVKTNGSEPKIDKPPATPIEAPKLAVKRATVKAAKPAVAKPKPVAAKRATRAATEVPPVTDIKQARRVRKATAAAPVAQFKQASQ